MSGIELTIYQLISGELELAEVELWVHSETELEILLSSDEYLKLISLNYKTPSSLYKAVKLLKKHIAPDEYYDWLVRRMLQKIINKSSDAHKYIEQSYDLYTGGLGFLDNLGLGYGLAVTTPPSNYNAASWKELSSSDQDELVKSFYPAVVEEAKKVVSWFDSGKITITGDSVQSIKYKDTRTAKEKEPTGYKAS